MSAPIRDYTYAQLNRDLLQQLAEVEHRLTDFALMCLCAHAETIREQRNEEDQPTPDWRPWAELRRREHLTLRWTELTGARGLIESLPARRQIHLDPDLAYREMAQVLTHELTHDDRGFGYTAEMDDATVDAEESVVWAITRERMQSGRNGTPQPTPERVRGVLGRRAPSVPLGPPHPEVEHMRNCLTEIRRWTIEGAHPRTPRGADDEAERLRTVLHEVQQWCIEALHREPKVGAS